MKNAKKNAEKKNNLVFASYCLSLFTLQRILCI